jgi:copper chaperone CopZ
MKRVISFLVLFTLFSPVVLSQAEPPPLLHVRLKIEGVQKKRSIASIHQALLSVPGVKKADLNVPKRWFFFNDYDNVYALVEFEHGTLTSETLIRAVERISGPKNIYKVKFVE